MRVPVAACLLLTALLAGCLSSPPPLDLDCPPGAHETRTLWFGPGGTLVNEVPVAAGAEPGNGFATAFSSNDLHPWRSEPLAAGVHMAGEVELDFWVRHSGTPAPLTVGGGPGEGYHFFNQFGSDRTFQPAYSLVHADPLTMPGAVARHTDTLELPPGGFVVEEGNRVSVLLTGLIMEGLGGDAGHEILYGPETPSRVTFAVTCYPRTFWTPVDHVQEEVRLPANQGLLTGALPPTEGLNRHTLPFTLHPETDRLTFSVLRTGGPNPVKDDIDLYLVDAAGSVVWSAATPYTDETGVLWRANLDALAPPGEYRVRVDSYSGFGYEGVVSVVQERAG